jgi:hypothetical protein
MIDSYVQSKIEYLNLLFSYFSDISLESEVKSHIAKYLTVLTSGVYEAQIKHLLKKFFDKDNLSREIKGFLDNQISLFRNPSKENIQKILLMETLLILPLKK